MFKIIVILAITIVITSACSPGASSPIEGGWVERNSFLASGTGTNNKINIALESRPNRIHYIYRKDPDNKFLKLIAKTPLSNFADTNIEENKLYSYQIATANMGLDQVVPAEEYTIETSYKTCFSTTRIQTLKQISTLEVLLPELKSFYSDCKSEISVNVEGGLTETETAIVFSLILSHNLAPYGNSSELRIVNMFHEKYLNCGNYTWLLADIFKAIVGLNYPGQLSVVGFNGGSVGNHAQVIYSDGQSSLLLDPTVGIIARTTYEDLLNGLPITDTRIDSLYSYWTNSHQNPLIHLYHWNVMRSLKTGLYKPSDALYVYPVPKTSIDDVH